MIGGDPNETVTTPPQSDPGDEQKTGTEPEGEEQS